jgi:hypothetical protein
LAIKFHGNLPIGSKVIGDGDRDREKHRQAGDLKNLVTILNESRLKTDNGIKIK